MYGTPSRGTRMGRFGSSEPSQGGYHGPARMYGWGSAKVRRCDSAIRTNREVRDAIDRKFPGPARVYGWGSAKVRRCDSAIEGSTPARLAYMGCAKVRLCESRSQFTLHNRTCQPNSPWHSYWLDSAKVRRCDCANRDRNSLCTFALARTEVRMRSGGRPPTPPLAPNLNPKPNSPWHSYGLDSAKVRRCDCANRDRNSLCTIALEVG